MCDNCLSTFLALVLRFELRHSGLADLVFRDFFFSFLLLFFFSVSLSNSSNLICGLSERDCFFAFTDLLLLLDLELLVLLCRFGLLDLPFLSFFLEDDRFLDETDDSRFLMEEDRFFSDLESLDSWRFLLRLCRRGFGLSLRVDLLFFFSLAGPCSLLESDLVDDGFFFFFFEDDFGDAG